MLRRVLLTTLVLLGSEIMAQEMGILNKKAPAWNVKQWHQLPDDKNSLDIGDFKGKVVYLFAFQAWCPACNSHGFPTLKKLTEEYKNDDRVAFVAIQTPFEGFSSNTFRRAKQMSRKYKLKIPIGHTGNTHDYSGLMKAYRTGGTPWTIIIDQKGIVRFNSFHITVDQAKGIIEKFMGEEETASTK